MKDSFSVRILLIVPLSRPWQSVHAIMYAYSFAGVIFRTVAEYARDGRVTLLDAVNGFGVGLAYESTSTLSAIAAEVAVREMIAFEALANSAVCMYVWSPHIARVRIHRVKLPILLVVS